jgi:outer membrane immunogenic protein
MLHSNRGAVSQGYFMKRLVLAVSLLGISAASALAADLPMKAPVAAPAVYDWSGIYFGGFGGWASSRDCWVVNQTALVGVIQPGINEGCGNATGGVAGGSFGYRFQSGNLVAGMDAMGGWAGLSGSNTSLAAGLIGAAVTNQSKMDAFGLYTGHFGLAWNNSLFYLKTGLAVTDNKYQGQFTGTGVAFDQANETRVGYAIGLGYEYGFTPNWSVGVEYNHFFMFNSANNLNLIGTNTLSRVDTIQQDVDMVLLKVNYHFGLGGPVVAKY